MKKRILSLLLSAALSVSLFAGCGQKTEEQPSKSVDSGTVSKESEEKQLASVEEDKPLYPLVEEPITVKGVIVGNSTGESRLIWDKVSEITGVNFEWVVIAPEAVNTFLTSDWDFDFIHNAGSASDMLASDYGVLGGKLADYNDYLDLMPHLQKAFEEYPSAKTLVTESNGAIYRLPNIELSATLTGVRSYYRTDLLEKYDIPVPATTEEFYQALKTYKEKNGTAGFSFFNYNDDDCYWAVMLYAAFGSSVDPNFEDDGTGKVVYNRTSEQYKHYLEYMHKLYSEGLIQEEYMTLDRQVAIGLASSGDTVFYASEAEALGAEAFPDGKFTLSAMAPLTSEYADDQEILARFPISKGGMYLNAKSKYLNELVQVIDIMYATEEIVEGSGLHGESFCYGIEGVDYIKNDDFTYELIAPEGYDSFTQYQYDELIWTNAGRATDLEGYVTSTPGNGQARQWGFRDNVLPYACDLSKVFPMSFLQLTSDEQDVIANRFTNIKSYVGEMRDKFIQGVVDIETGWDDYCATIEQMHIDEVLKAYQAAYDRYNK